MVILGAVFNVGYFLTWHPQEKAILQEIQQDATFATSLPNNENMRENLTWWDVLLQQGGSQNPQIHNQSHYYFISDSLQDYAHINNKEKRSNNEIQVVSYHWYDFMSRAVSWWTLLVDISGYKEKEDMLITLTFILLIFMVWTIFFITRVLIIRSLRDLTQLETYTNKLNSDAMAEPLLFKHLTTQDPIQRLSQAIFNFHTQQFEYTENIRQFMSSVAHEIKTPLQVIQTKIDLELAQNTGSKNMITIENQVHHITELIDVLSRLTFAQYQKFPLVVVDAETIVHDIVNDFEIQYPTYQWEYARTKGNYQKKGSKASIITIISNILQNAMKYSKPWSVISISVSQDFCIITDQGIGLNNDQLSCIRDPFWQADTSRGKDSGFWLWLTLVKKLVVLHWWNIQCTSIENNGTTFIISR